MEATNHNKKLPIELEVMIQILTQNGMYPEKEKLFSKGKTPEDAIVIDLIDDYVHQEYVIARHIFYMQGYWHYKLINQAFLCVNKRYFDKLVFEVASDSGISHEEQLYFDITVGFTAMRSLR